jgi:hypothetical protein
MTTRAALRFAGIVVTVTSVFGMQMRPRTRLVLTAVLLPPVITAVSCGVAFGALYLVGNYYSETQITEAVSFSLIAWYVLMLGWTWQAWRGLRQRQKRNRGCEPDSGGNSRNM